MMFFSSEVVIILEPLILVLFPHKTALFDVLGQLFRRLCLIYISPWPLSLLSLMCSCVLMGIDLKRGGHNKIEYNLSTLSTPFLMSKITLRPRTVFEHKWSFLLGKQLFYHFLSFFPTPTHEIS